MALSGYQGVDIPVNVKMDGVIHDTYTVSFEPPAFTTIDHDSFTFTNANWNVNQVLTINCSAIGNCKIPVKITAPYNPDGELDTAIDVDILPLPLDSWVGSVPAWRDGGAGDFQIAHNNVVVGHKVNIKTNSWVGIGGDSPFLVASLGTLLVDLPDGSHASISMGALGNTTIYTMALLGVYRFRIAMTPCWIQAYDVPTSHVIQATVFRYNVTDSVGTNLLGPIDSPATKSQGMSVRNDNTGWSFNDTPRHADGPFSLVVPSAVQENTIIEPISIHNGPNSVVETNCTGTTIDGAAATVQIAGTRINFASGVSCSRAGMEVWLGGQNTGITFAAGYANV